MSNSLSETHIDLMAEETARVVDELFREWENEKRVTYQALEARVSILERQVRELQRRVA